MLGGALSSNIPVPWILLLLRVVLAVVMIHYGWPKIRNLESNANDFVHMGFKPGRFWGTLIAVVEFFGGLAILVGFYAELDRKSTRLNSSHGYISYAVFCLKKKKNDCTDTVRIHTS